MYRICAWCTELARKPCLKSARCHRKWFDKVVLGEECANPKPYPDPYQEGLKAFGISPEETIVCEDSPSGEAWALDLPS